MRVFYCCCIPRGIFKDRRMKRVAQWVKVLIDYRQSIRLSLSHRIAKLMTLSRSQLDRSIDVEENWRTSGEDIVRSSSADYFRWKDRIGNEIWSERRRWTIRVNNNRYSIGQRKSFWSIDCRPRGMTHRHGLGQYRLSPSPSLSNLFTSIFILRHSIVRLLTEDVFHASRWTTVCFTFSSSRVDGDLSSISQSCLVEKSNADWHSSRRFFPTLPIIWSSPKKSTFVLSIFIFSLKLI